MKNLTTTLLLLLSFSFFSKEIEGCTGITLRSSDGSTIVARTIEWGGSDLNSMYIVVPRGYSQQSFTPEGQNGMIFTSEYGYVGLAVENSAFIAEGLNESGLSAGLFYFPKYGKYIDYSADKKHSSIADLQLVSLILGSCKNLKEVRDVIKHINIISIDPRASTVHWRFADMSGQELVLEIIDGSPVFYENKIGVLTNSPDFSWHLTNLNNYVNLYPGSSSPNKLDGLTLSSLGAGSGFLGIPGDVTPPSRFVRAAFYKSTAPIQKNSQNTVMQAFQILNNFDIPIGIEFPLGKIPADIPSATQWTSVVDINNGKVYFRTMYNSAIRCIDLKSIDFEKVSYSSTLLDNKKEQPVIFIEIKS